MQHMLHSRRLIQVLAVLLIVAGAMLALRYARGSISAYRAIQFAIQNDFDAGNVDVDLLQPWMTLRYVAEAYAVPQSYLFEKLDVPMGRATSRIPLGRLNRRQRFGEVDDEPDLVEKTRQAILAYRRNPVVTGLTERRVAHWMNMQYVANSTGIPLETLFAAIDIAAEGHAYMPFGWLVDQTDYEPGLEYLLNTLQRLVDEHEVPPQ